MSDTIFVEELTLKPIGGSKELVDRTNELYSGHAILRDGSA
jgi:hypothetical protein